MFVKNYSKMFCKILMVKINKKLTLQLKFINLRDFNKLLLIYEKQKAKVKYMLNSQKLYMM